MPDVAGQSEQAAGATLRRAGLTPVPRSPPARACAAGVVISQSPPAGSVVDKGSHVTIVVSGGPASAALPDVDGLTPAQASASCTKPASSRRRARRTAARSAAGRVIGTEPACGHRDRSSAATVIVLVSSGPAPVTVPDVVGQSQAAAEATLSNAGLAVGTVTQGVLDDPGAGHRPLAVARATARAPTRATRST